MTAPALPPPRDLQAPARGLLDADHPDVRRRAARALERMAARLDLVEDW